MKLNETKNKPVYFLIIRSGEDSPIVNKILMTKSENKPDIEAVEIKQEI